jgi:membrane-bound serine protease (ClpP class)
VHVGRIEGVINPVTAQYVDRVISQAEREGARAIVFTIDTPGGVIGPTFRITTRFLNASVPVMTYVSPSGGRAASAGTFITMAGHIAAMAPATNIGAAHPVDATGGNIEGDLGEKVLNDTVAEAQKIAIARERNADWAEDAVRDSVSVRDDEAVKLDVVDFVAQNIPDVLRQAHGRSVEVSGQRVTLDVAGAATQPADPNPIERFLHIIVDPQIAILLFTLGTYGLIFELSNPGLILPGIVGVLAIVLALFAFGTLDANAAGIALIVFATILFIAEIKVVSHGLLTAGGIISLIFGAILLFPPWIPTLPGLRLTVEPGIIAAIVGVTGLFFLLIFRAALRMRQLPVVSGAEALRGALGTAETDLDPSGVVRVGGEPWSAAVAAGRVAKGQRVRVRRVDSVRLIVEAAEGEDRPARPWAE